MYNDYIAYARSNIYAIPERPCNSATARAIPVWGNPGTARSIPVWPESRNGPEHIYPIRLSRNTSGNFKVSPDVSPNL